MTNQQSTEASQNLSTPPTTLPILQEKEFDDELSIRMRGLEDYFDSPLTRMIIKNLFSILLESNRKCEGSEVLNLIDNDVYRKAMLDLLRSRIPNYASEEWLSYWKIEVAPLYSSAHQRILRLSSLITFWTIEWQAIPEETKQSVRHLLHEIYG